MQGNCFGECYFDFTSNDEDIRKKLIIFTSIYYCFSILLIVYSIFSVIQTKFVLSSFKELTEEEVDSHISDLKFYPIVLIVTIIPVISYRIIEIYTKERFFWLAVIQILLDSSRSVLFLICFSLNNNVKRLIKKVIYRGRVDSFELESNSRKRTKERLFRNTCNDLESSGNFNDSSFISNYDDDNYLRFSKVKKNTNNNPYI